MKIYAKINIGSSSRKLIRNDDLIFKILGEKCHVGWHKFDVNSEVLESVYKISAERGMTIGTYASPVFSPKELKSFTHFIPNFNDLKMTNPQILNFLGQVRSFELKDLGGIGKVALPENITLKNPIKISQNEIKRVTYHSEEIVATASFIDNLNNLGAGLSECSHVGRSIGGEEVLLLKTNKFTSSVVMNETITDRLGLNNEAKSIENRFYQSGSRCYRDLSEYGLMTRTVDSLSMQESPPWIVNQMLVDLIKTNLIRCRFDPVFQIGTPICDAYLLQWSRFSELVSLNPNNYIKFG